MHVGASHRGRDEGNILTLLKVAGGIICIAILFIPKASLKDQQRVQRGANSCNLSCMACMSAREGRLSVALVFDSMAGYYPQLNTR